MAWPKGQVVNGLIEIRKHGLNFAKAVYGRKIQGHKVNVVAKTSSYTVLDSECWTIFTTEGAAGAVTFTLPAATDGLIYFFAAAEDQNMIIASPVADTIISFNDVEADSVEFSTAGNKAGAFAIAFSDGSKWFVINLSANTATINT